MIQRPIPTVYAKIRTAHGKHYVAMINKRLLKKQCNTATEAETYQSRVLARLDRQRALSLVK